MPRSVTAIVVNWNGAEHLPDCLDSLAVQSHTPFDVIVVDNASSDDSQTIVRDRGARWLGLPRNIGLAAAFNEGAKLARGELLLFLNNDMRFAPDFVERMVACLERHPACLAVDAVQRDWGDEEVVHAATALAKGPWREPLPGWRFASIGLGPDLPTAFASGANTLISAAALQELGGWDGRFFAGYEDVDLGWRIWLRGGEVRLAEDAICWHKVGASSEGEGRPVRRAASVHGPVLFAIKHAPARVLLAALVRLAVGTAGAVVRRRDVPTYAHAVRLLARDGTAAAKWRKHSYWRSGVSTRILWSSLVKESMRPTQGSGGPADEHTPRASGARYRNKFRRRLR